MPTHRLFIPDWRPARLNTILGHWAKAGRIKKKDREIVGVYFHLEEIPKATGKRRVSLEIVLKGRQKQTDPDAYWKSLLDSLTACGAIVDDSEAYVELAGTTYRNGEPCGTTIIMADLCGKCQLIHGKHVVYHNAGPSSEWDTCPDCNGSGLL